MSRLKEFHFEWCDAWHNIDDGYDTILETSEQGMVSLQCLVNLKVQKIDITDKEDEFIQNLEACKIASWDGKRYCNFDYEDGSMWTLDVAYDDTVVRTKGMNGYPEEFETFINTLVKGWGLREAKICTGMESWMKKAVKGTVAKTLCDYEMAMPPYR